ncbi:MAG: hypothetical protein JO119_15025 [Acidobacteria bacterium]|nr:hypothetical protein [Acidobacteriota bacterium]
MGIGLSIVSWCAKGIAIATLLAVFAGALTAIQVPRGREGRTRLILWTCVYPFACFIWFLAVFIFQAYVNETLLYRDPGPGHLYQTPLPNGYAVLLIDEIHDGSVFNPATHFSNASNEDIHPDGPDAVSGVRVLQVAGTKILGGAGPIGEYSSAESRDRVDYYFLLDTDARTRTNFQTYDALTKAAQASGIQPHLEPLLTIYQRYRYTWFDLSALALFLIPALGAGFAILRRISRLQRDVPALATAHAARRADDLG